MGKPTFLDEVRKWIGGIAFDVFLWSIRMTADEYRQVLILEEVMQAHFMESEK